MEIPPRKHSFSSDISNISGLPTSPDIDERIEEIREAIRQKEIERQKRHEAFTSRSRQVRKRIDTLQTIRVKRLLECGINIDLDVIRCGLSKEALKWKRKFEKEEEENTLKVPLIPEPTMQENITKGTPQIIEEPEVKTSQKATKKSEKLNAEEFVFSVKDELAKLNLIPPNKNKKGRKDKTGKEVHDVNETRNQENSKRRKSLVLAVAEEKNNVGSKEGISMEAGRLPLLGSRDKRRSSISLERPDQGGGRRGSFDGLARRGSFDAMSPFQQRRRSSVQMDPPKWADNLSKENEKPKAKGRRKPVQKEAPMWGDILKMGRENEKKDKKKKKS